MQDCRFEEMREELLPEVLEIYNYYIENSTATFHVQTLSMEEIREIVFNENPRFKTYAIFTGENLCGYCILAQFKKREAYDQTAEVTVYLKPEFTGKGLGKLAVQEVEKLAAQNGFHTLLAVICGENDSSIRLFEKMGYEKCSHYKEVGKKFGRMLDVVCYQKMI